MLKSFFSVQNVLRFRLFFGYYFHSRSSKIVTTLKVLYCLVYSSFVVYIVVQNNKDFLFFKTLLPIKYSVQVIMLFYVQEAYFLRYTAGMKTLDGLIRYNKNNFDPYISTVSTTVAMILKHIYDYALNMDEMSFSIKYICEYILKTSNYVWCLPRVIIFEMLWSRVRFIRRKLKRSCENKGVREKCYAIKKFLHAYKILLDTYRHTNTMVKLSILIDISYYFIKTVNYSQIGITHVVNEGFDKLGLFYTLQGLFGLISATSTPILQELVQNEYDEIKSILGNELLDCDDENLHSVLETAVEYIEIRPPEQTLWRILPMDINLVKSFISATITYIIIIVSFQL